MIKPVDNSENIGPFIGDEWWLAYEKTESGDDTKPYRQYSMYSKEYGYLGLSPWLDDLDEDTFAQMMLIRAAPKLLTVLNWIAQNFPQMPHHDCVQQVVNEAQWSWEEWYKNEREPV